MTVCHELSQPERIVCTEMFVDEEGHLLAEMPELLVMMELHDEGNNHTRVMVSYRFAS